MTTCVLQGVSMQTLTAYMQMTEARPALPSSTDDSPKGCGWFDSSYELQRGLEVHEHASLAQVAPLMAVDDWLRLHLSLSTSADKMSNLVTQST